ncbi:GNAT family N-acetyltransferase [Actinoplanes missouriensis]|uniref:GNAT family N-acetyltransferase n=1 Tax=Actinoplanes missouriensis TaxID=1866 RepID=UPI0033C5A1C8
MNVSGELVMLRAMGPEDAKALWRWNHDPDVMRWMDEGYPQSLASVQRWMTEDRPRNDFGDVLFGVETLDEGNLIGMVRLHGAEPELGGAELDVYLGEKNYWGKGYGTDAVRTACRFGFDKMRLHRIQLTVAAENESARHIYRKVGFVEEGRLRHTFRSGGQWGDKFVMGLLEGELR